MKKLLFSLIIFAGVFMGCGEESRLWPDGKIFFTTIGLSDEELKTVLCAMADWEIATGGTIKFVPTDQCGDGVVHISKLALPLMVGGIAYTGYSNTDYMSMILNEIFINDYICRHEIGHIIGLEDNAFLLSIMFFAGYPDETKNITTYDVMNVKKLYEKNK
jgi:hypothetical protein